MYNDFSKIPSLLTCMISSHGKEGYSYQCCVYMWLFVCHLNNNSGSLCSYENFLANCLCDERMKVIIVKRVTVSALMIHFTPAFL